MSVLRPDRILEACVIRRASEVRLAVGRPVTLVIGQQVQELRTDLLTLADLASILEWLKPARAKTTSGRLDADEFEIGYVDDRGEETRFRVFVQELDAQPALVLRRATEPSAEPPRAMHRSIPLGSPSMN